MLVSSVALMLVESAAPALWLFGETQACQCTRVVVTSAEASPNDLDDDAVTRRAQARVGSVLRSKWRIDRVLGIGGMAAVYEGTHRNGKRGAIKMLHLELSMDPDARARFLREGYVANNVGHAGAVSVLDDDVAEDGSVFVVMELLEGKTLDALASSRPSGRLSVTETLHYLDQLLDVLASAHEKGIVHRDLKPENLFVTREGVLKVLDFGLARMREHASAGKMTKTGNAMGTPAFMPPEQALGEWDRVDGRSDLWAVGASIFTLLSGRLVHDAPTLNQLLLKAMTQAPPSIRTVIPRLPDDVVFLVDKALAFKPEDRFQDARQMQAATRKAIAFINTNGEPQNLEVVGAVGVTNVFGVDSFSPTLPQARKGRSRLPLVVGGLVFAVLAGVVVFVLMGGGLSAGVENRPLVVAGGASPATRVSAVPIALGVPSALVSASAAPFVAVPSASASVKKVLGPKKADDFNVFK